MDQHIEFYDSIVRTVNEYYPESVFHSRLKRKAKQVIQELKKETPNCRKLQIMFAAFYKMGEKR